MLRSSLCFARKHRGERNSEKSKAGACDVFELGTPFAPFAQKVEAHFQQQIARCHNDVRQRLGAEPSGLVPAELRLTFFDRKVTKSWMGD
eukprot:SAG11_NODE_8535_length_1004_cov_1.116022_1_plen_89_part_10